MLNRHKNIKLRKAVIANANADFLCCLAECVYIILKGNVPLTTVHKKTLKVQASHARVEQEEDVGQKEERDPTERWLPVGLPSSVGEHGSCSLARTAIEVEAWSTRVN